MSYSKLQNFTCSIKASGGDSRKMHSFAIYTTCELSFGREMRVKEAVTHKRAQVGGPMVFGDGFRVCRADAETDGKCHRGQARRARQVADGKRLRREIRVFPPQAQTVTKNHQRPNAEARVRRVCGICGVERMRSGANHTVSPLGAKRPTLPALGRFGRLGAKRKGFQVWRGESGQY